MLFAGRSLTWMHIINQSDAVSTVFTRTIFSPQRNWLWHSLSCADLPQKKNTSSYYSSNRIHIFSLFAKGIIFPEGNSQPLVWHHLKSLYCILSVKTWLKLLYFAVLNFYFSHFKPSQLYYCCSWLTRTQVQGHVNCLCTISFLQQMRLLCLSLLPVYISPTMDDRYFLNIILPPNHGKCFVYINLYYSSLLAL